ncbi:MAG: ABC transporter permease [Myxococcales bacterium]|nr:ABC transporter permease [Myxococcales bacterium]
MAKSYERRSVGAWFPSMPFEWLVALRYLGAKRKAGVSVTGVLTVSGVALGVWALTVVTSVWNGFEAEFLQKLLGINAHAMVTPQFDILRKHKPIMKRLLQHDEVIDAVPFIYTEAIIQSPQGVKGVMIKGIDPKAALRLPLADYVGKKARPIFSTLEARSSATASPNDLPGIIIGSELQKTLHVKPGDKISVISPYGGHESEARTAAFEVLGTFHSGMFEFDARMVFVALKQAQKFLRLHHAVMGLEVWTRDPFSSGEVLSRAIKTLDPDNAYAFKVLDWSKANEGIFGAFHTQKLMISLFLFFIVVVAAFNIMATLILLIIEKGREIAVLKSIGASPRSILLIFVVDGQLVGLLGCLTGVILGLITCTILEQHGLKMDPRVYFLEQFPIIVKPKEIALVIFGAMVLATLATTFPALRAAQTLPVEGLTRRAARRS